MTLRWPTLLNDRAERASSGSSHSFRWIAEGRHFFFEPSCVRKKPTLRLADHDTKPHPHHTLIKSASFPSTGGSTGVRSEFILPNMAPD